MPYSNYAVQIQKLLAESLSPEAVLIHEQSLKNLQNLIDQYLFQLEQWNVTASQYLSNFQFNNPDMKPELQRYITAKEMIKLNPQIESQLKDGYVIIDKIRQYFTGETITYSIGVEFNGKLYEGNMSIEQIMNIAQVTPEWKGSVNSMVKLRLTGTSRTSLASQLSEIEDFKSGTHSTLYSSIRAYASSNAKYNKGNLYEAYKILKYSQGSNLIPPAEWNAEEFEQALLSVRKNTGSYVKGGDILTEQVKFFGGRAPSLTTLATIRTTLKQFNALISNFSGSKLKTGLNQLFLKDQAVFNASQSVQDFTEEEIDKLLAIFKLK